MSERLDLESAQAKSTRKCTLLPKVDSFEVAEAKISADLC